MPDGSITEHNPTEWGSIADYGAKYGLSDSTVRRMISAGELAARRFGRQIRIDLNQNGRPVTFLGGGAH
ncbi:helix-turn-helix domain-containing protein [Microbacterium sp. NPDC058062]|uniref:helix-turn-helix domain-containing protein n=1 Tax=Microbacterium sp. NPDC058062 TaxID=3346320 RepID=UPI0036DB64BC